MLVWKKRKMTLYLDSQSSIVNGEVDGQEPIESHPQDNEIPIEQPEELRTRLEDA